MTYGNARFRRLDDAETLEQATLNIKIYPLLKIFNKRVFLPIVAIYYIDYIGFSLPQIGLLAALYAVIGLAANLPTGYVADRFGKTLSLRIAAALLIVSTMLYGVVATKIGVIAGLILEALAFAFLTGASEALVHDSLEIKGELQNYSKRLSHAQSIALLWNALFVATIPMTYAIDPRLPFLVGTAAFAILFFASMYVGEVIERAPARKMKLPEIKVIRGLLQYKVLIAFGILFGVVGALYYSFDIMTIAMKQFGLKPSYIGWVFALASIFGAFIGLFVHHLKRVPISLYMSIDMIILLLPLIAATTSSYVLLAIAIIINIGFWRYRRIIYQAHVLEKYPTRYKSTIISGMGTTENVNSLWVPIVVTSTAATYGIAHGLGLIGIGVLILSVPYIWLGAKSLKSN